MGPNRTLLLVASMALLGACAPATASFPQKSITIIVPYSAGGGTDLMARSIAGSMKADLGQEVVVVNKVGGSGTIGVTEAISAKPDGHTLGISSFSINTITVHAVGGLSWGAPSDYEPLGGVARGVNVLTVPPDAPYKTLPEFIAFAKANPGKLKVGGAALGGINHILWVQFARAAGIEAQYVPFPGEADVTTAFLGGHVDVTSSPISSLVQHFKAGKARFLGVWAPERSPISEIRDVPTFKEQGFDVTMTSNYFMLAPKGVPDQALQKLRASVKRAVESNQYRDALQSSFVTPLFTTPEQTRSELERDYTAMKAFLPTLNLPKQ